MKWLLWVFQFLGIVVWIGEPRSMSKLPLVRKLILLENVVCVYRNYSFIDKTLLYFVPIRILLELILFLYAFIRFLPSCVTLFNTFDYSGAAFIISYNLFSKMNTLLAIISGVSNTNSFKQYIDNIDAVHDLCDNEVLYSTSFQKLYKRFAIAAGVAGAIGAGLLLIYIFEFRQLLINEDYNYSLALDLLFDYIVQCRYILECVAFCAYIEIVVMYLQYLNSSVLVSAKILTSKSDDLESGFLPKLSDDLEQWGTMSRLLADSSKQMKYCFGYQIGFTLLTSAFYYIFLSYRLIYELAQKKAIGHQLNGWSMMFLLATFFLIKILVVRAGQRARNESDALEAALAILKYLVSGRPEASTCVRRLRAWQRLVRCAPARMRLRPARALRMALLPEMLAAVVANTVLLLQFNHVL